MEPEPEISVIVEWENVALSGDDRALAMLRALGRQLRDLDRDTEVIIVANPDAADAERARALADGLLQGVTRVRFERAPGLHYYELKNRGAALARGDILVFLDSDAIPEDDWLSELLKPFDEASAKVVAGTTHLTQGTLYEKAFALGWFFPLRDPGRHVDTKATGFFANNVAFRRAVFAAHPFPAMPSGVTRGACVRLAASLVDAGVAIWRTSAARAQHPPPSGATHYVVRAMAHGRDIIMGGAAPPLTLGGALTWSLGQAISAARRTRWNHQRVGLPAWQTPAALCIMAGYYGLVAVGSCGAWLFPGVARTRWRI